LRKSKEIRKLFGERSALVMRNPFNVDQNCYRSSRIPGLLDSVRLNIQNSNSDMKIFETGHMVLTIRENFDECLAVSCVMATKPPRRSWRATESSDFYNIQALTFRFQQNFRKNFRSFVPQKIATFGNLGMLHMVVF
jgi:phenylalanyl-tRNA synthetase beta subunit